LIKGPFEFDAAVLISALRIATAYDYPELRTFSIGRLQKLCLAAIQRIQLAREFNLAGWEEAAINELVTREEAITKEEAQVLGTDKMEEVAKAREEEKKKKGMEERREEEKREAEEKAKREEEERQRAEEERLKREAEEQAKRDEEERARKEAEEKANQEKKE
jgi:dTMP kinase